MKKVSLLILSLLLSVLVLVAPAAACSNNDKLEFEGVTITDDLGRNVVIEGTPSRIVSLAPSNTEILFALGLGDRVVGVTDICDYPEEVLGIEKVGGYYGVEIEKIVAINPDLILAEDLHKNDVIPALEDLGFTVVAIVPHTLQEVMDSIEFIGIITGAEAMAEQIVSDMEQRIQEITDITSTVTEEEKTSVLYVIWHDPICSVGSDTRIHELIELAGGINVAAIAGEGYPTLTLEEIIAANPEVIIVNDDVPLDAILNESRLSEVDAIVNGRVYSINADLTNRPTPRIIEGLELIARILHPELFGDSE